MTTTTLYGELPTALLARFADIRLLALDVDGVFSDGRIYLGNQGEELKAFHTLDGYGIKAIMTLGVDVAVITGRRSSLVEQRMQALGVRYIIQGEEDKQHALSKLQQQLGFSAQQVAAMGDDMPDLGMFACAGLSISVPDGHPFVQQQADYITQRSGGFGAVREICDHILQAQGLLDVIMGSST
ncbi:3-deoxy-manno-octulosonate-8-phosphatase KdsC [Aestuariibacter halophilus]|uniref:3-deoxy-D-manno-octulosonate 8-phosphate phosphatase KdsC n=1 Tax=Fluctibacter halophilus TaxID=226011 RepID=A0ABS8GBC7_9ALTE|nr:3-deoxy-manno-octulosonate-8-phosphatase KdsC [Aestuariibacter halophilus]MCC2617847.1 3-deoxy-manno-octulosonate-8-phosphatase KdsC [Aestuariibacter halophilus]